jgi:hypothetical protein
MTAAELLNAFCVISKFTVGGPNTIGPAAKIRRLRSAL